MAVIRGPLPTDNFTIVSNDWARDPALSCKAKGLLLAIASHSEGYRLTVQQLIAQNKDGRDSIVAGLRELVDAGYMRVIQPRGSDGRMGEVDYVLTGKLSRDHAGSEPDRSESPRSSKRRLRRSAPVTDFPVPVDEQQNPRSAPVTDFPVPVEPVTDFPLPENPTLRRPLPKKTNVTSTCDVEVRPVDNQEPVVALARTSFENTAPTTLPAGPPTTETLTVLTTPVTDIAINADPEDDLYDDEVERTVLQLPAQLRPDLSHALRLQVLIKQRFQHGWRREDILQVVQERLRPGSLANPCGLFAAVLVPQGERPPVRVKGNHIVEDPWCGHCDKRTRRPLDSNDLPDFTQPRCSECRQLAFSEHMERNAS